MGFQLKKSPLCIQKGLLIFSGYLCPLPCLLEMPYSGLNIFDPWAVTPSGIGARAADASDVRI